MTAPEVRCNQAVGRTGYRLARRLASWVRQGRVRIARCPLQRRGARSLAPRCWLTENRGTGRSNSELAGSAFASSSQGRCHRSLEAVNLLRIVAEDRLAFGFTHGDFDRKPRVIIIPVRIVAGVDHAVPTDPIKQRA